MMGLFGKKKKKEEEVEVLTDIETEAEIETDIDLDSMSEEELLACKDVNSILFVNFDEKQEEPQSFLMHNVPIIDEDELRNDECVHVSHIDFDCDKSIDYFIEQLQRLKSDYNA